MSTTKTKKELVRMAWITALRRQGDRQCHHYSQGDPSKVCALQILCEVVCGSPFLGQTKALVAAGLRDRGCDIAHLNDGGFHMVSGVEGRKHTFSEIADVVEGWFVSRGVKTGQDI